MNVVWGGWEFPNLAGTHLIQSARHARRQDGSLVCGAKGAEYFRVGYGERPCKRCLKKVEAK